VFVLGLIVTAAMALGMVATIGSFATVAILARERCCSFSLAPKTGAADWEKL
jgi:hypothetical protein